MAAAVAAVQMASTMNDSDELTWVDLGPGVGASPLAHRRRSGSISSLFPSMRGEAEYLVEHGFVVDGFSAKWKNRSEWAPSTLVISNFRLCIIMNYRSMLFVPLKVIDRVEKRSADQCAIFCKDGRLFVVAFSMSERCDMFCDQLEKSATPFRLEGLFAFGFARAYPELRVPQDWRVYDAVAEYRRLGFLDSPCWRLSLVNADYTVASSYPAVVAVPSGVSDQQLQKAGQFRAKGRFPAAVWKKPGSNAVIARSSQPCLGVLGSRRCAEDELLLSEMAAISSIPCLDIWRGTASSDPYATRDDKGECAPAAKTAPSGMMVAGKDVSKTAHAAPKEKRESLSSAAAAAASDGRAKPRKLVYIVDARPFANALANQAKGGGYENLDYYGNCRISFMGVHNIHAVRDSYLRVSELCQSRSDDANWLSALESTKWLQLLSVLMMAATEVVNHVDANDCSVLVHCSDGWDRTAQLTSLAELMLDPYYRTIKGFQVLVEKEWMSFGHRFADRMGHAVPPADPMERSPVFVQWLDSVHQVFLQHPCAFQFNERLLLMLADLAYTCLYGTFLCNSERERKVADLAERTSSIWSVLRTGEPTGAGANFGLNTALAMGGAVNNTMSHATPASNGGTGACGMTSGSDEKMGPPSSTSSSSPVPPKRSSVPQLPTRRDFVNPLYRPTETSGVLRVNWRDRCLSVWHAHFFRFEGQQQQQHQQQQQPTTAHNPTTAEVSGRGSVPSSGGILGGFGTGGGGGGFLLREMGIRVTELERTARDARLELIHQRSLKRRHKELLSRAFSVWWEAADANREHRVAVRAACRPIVHDIIEASLAQCGALPRDGSLGAGRDSVGGRRLMYTGGASVAGVGTAARLGVNHFGRVGRASSTGALGIGMAPTPMSFGTPLGSVDESPPSPLQIAPTVLWVPDHAATACMKCHTKFWLAVRKHHCRSCGGVYCGTCSGYFAPIPDLGILETVRVCCDCYASLVSAQSADADQSPTKCTDDDWFDAAGATSSVAVSVVDAHTEGTSGRKTSTSSTGSAEGAKQQHNSHRPIAKRV
eukprot:Opistho-2@20041